MLTTYSLTYFFEQSIIDYNFSKTQILTGLTFHSTDGVVSINLNQ